MFVSQKLRKILDDIFENFASLLKIFSKKSCFWAQ